MCGSVYIEARAPFSNSSLRLRVKNGVPESAAASPPALPVARPLGCEAIAVGLDGRVACCTVPPGTEATPAVQQQSRKTFNWYGNRAGDTVEPAASSRQLPRLQWERGNRRQ